MEFKLESKEYYNLITCLPEEILGKDYIVATYFYRSTSEIDPFEKAKTFAIGQTLGTWVPVPGLTRDLYKKYGGRLVSIYDIPPVELTKDIPPETFHIIQIAFPDSNFSPQLPILLTTLLGNDVSTSAQLKLLDITFSKKFLMHFKGPKFGVDGVYKLLGIKRRPIVLNMIKPCLGYTPEEGAEIFKAVAMGGVDIIKDDELLSDTEYNPIEKRVKLYKKVAMDVQNETGHLTRYCVNITDRPDRMIEHAHRAVEAGADFLMVNFLTTGISSLQILAEDDSINIPILAHYATAGSLTESPFTGISTPLLLGKLSRIAGADMCMFSSPYSTYPFLRRKYIQIADTQKKPLYNILPTLPTVGGGVHPNSAAQIVKDLGKEVVLATGGAIIGHPLGPTEGARSMMQAVEALAQDLDLYEVANNSGYEALKISLEKWK
ncbi:MAG: transcriptional regulator [Actinobacteria bacterium]|nr:transcriptional regulator [Actinomycetota bacterium]